MENTYINMDIIYYVQLNIENIMGQICNYNDQSQKPRDVHICLLGHDLVPLSIVHTFIGAFELKLQAMGVFVQYEAWLESPLAPLLQTSLSNRL